MTRTAPTQRSFSAGEISPLLHRRDDYVRHQTGLAECNGFLPLRQGGVTRAPGTIRRGTTRGNAAARLLPFEFAENDAVVLEFTPLRMRVWRYGALVMAGAAPFEMVTPYDTADLPRLRALQSADVIYLVDGLRPIQRLTRFGLDNWTIAPAVFDRGPFRPQNLDEGLTVQASAIAGTVTLTASGALFQANHVGSLLALEPVDNTTVAVWTSNTTYNPGALVRNDGRIYRMAAGSPTDSLESPPVHAEGTALYAQNGLLWEVVSDELGIVRITAVASTTSATATVLKPLPQGVVASPTYRWSEGAWSNRYGWPSALEFYEQRLVAAATPTDPRTIWFSGIGTFTDFEPGTEADEAFAYDIAGTRSRNRILWLARGKTGLHIGALGEEYSVRTGGNAAALTAETAVFGVDSALGSADAQPIAPDGRPIFISRDGARLFEIAYSFQEDANNSRELSLPADHLGAAGFREIVWASAPTRIAWVRRGDGTLAALVHEPDEDVLGWAPLSLAGGQVESLAVTAAADGAADVVTAVVLRTIDGRTERHIEELAPVWGVLSGGGLAEACHLFCAAIFTPASPAASFSVPHLAGAEVWAWTDTGEHGPLTVAADGTVTLPEPVGRATIGLFDATHRMQTLDIGAAAPDGNTTGRRKRLHAALGIAVHRTAFGRVRTVTRALGQPDIVSDAQPLIPLAVANNLRTAWTGVGRIPAPSGHAQEVAVRVEPFGGAPLTITQITPLVEETGP